MKTIETESDGRLTIAIYNNNALGGDTAMISQAVSGALEMYSIAADLLATRNRACGIFGVGFAFPDYEHAWAAMDGQAGDHLRGIAETVGLHCLPKAFDHGFRHVTTRNKPIEKPEDLHGFKIRLPFAPPLITLFKHLGASPTAINGGEIYSALQTGIVDGQENPLVVVDTIKLYEVEKYCSMTAHTWMGIHVCFNMKAWQRLPPPLQELVLKNFTHAAVLQRADWQIMETAEKQNLQGKGMIFNTPDTEPFRAALRQSGFYPEMKQTCGDQAWALLEKYTGPLA